MLERLLGERETVGAALAGLQTDIPSLFSEEYEAVCEILKVLSPFNDATIELSAVKNVSGSKTIPILNMIDGVLQKKMTETRNVVVRDLGGLLSKLLREKVFHLQSR